MSQTGPLNVGAMVGRYTVGALRGCWRIGNAYDVMRDGTQRLLLTVAVRPGQMDRFLRWGGREASRAAQLPAEVIAPLEVGCLRGDVGWIALAPFSGASLLHRVRAEGPLSERAAVQLGLDVTRLVAAAHATGVRLGGLRPTTVLLDEGGPRLLSLGLRRGLGALLQAPPRPARRYQPPELDARGRPTCGEDVYALGALLWFALTAEKPPRPAEAGRVPTPPSWKRPQADASVLLDPVVMQALATEPGGRPADAGALAAALAAVAEVVNLQPAARALVGLPPGDAGFTRVNTHPNALYELLSSPGGAA